MRAARTPTSAPARALPTRDDVDQRYTEPTSAGYVGRQPPLDAFWAHGTRTKRCRADEPDRRITSHQAARAVPRIPERCGS